MNRSLSAWWLTTALLIWPLMARGQRTDSDLPRGEISGTVLFDADNRPADGVKVRLQFYGGGPAFDVFTRWGGSFQFGELYSGTYLVVVEEPGYERIEETVSVTNGLRRRLLLTLRKASLEISRQTSYVVSARELSIPTKARNAFEKGLERLAKKDAVGGLAHFQRAAAAFPNYYEAYYEMGVAQMKLGRNEEAELAFQKSIEMSSGHYAEPHLAWSMLLCDQQRFAEAEPIIRKALELDPDSGPGRFTLARALIGLNHLDEAEKNIREIVAREPKSALSHILLANIYIRRRDYLAVLVELEAYLNLEPNGAMSAQARHVREAVKRSLARSKDILAAAPTKP